MEQPKATTFLMFAGQAEEAMSFYTSLFEGSEVNQIMHHADGSVLFATFTIKGQMFMCIDSTVKHDFTFTPAISLFITCDTEREIDEVYSKLTQEGAVLMPLGPGPASEKFAWVNDKYGVSWQLNLPNKG